MGRKTSIVWNHFTIPQLYPKKAMCNYCNQLVCRGQANLGTTSLMNHLKRCNEFKANVLGIPRGITDMIAAAMSSADSPATKPDTDERADSWESGNLVDVEASDDSTNDLPRSNQEFSWQNTSENSSLSTTPRADDVPILTNRQFGYLDSESQNQYLSSVMLYGDISSTSECIEEPSSSTLTEGTTTNVQSTNLDLTNYVFSDAKVDLAYGGIMLQYLYQQYKAGKYCDIDIIPQKYSSNEVTISETGKVTKKNISNPRDIGKVSAHSCVLAAVSRRVNSIVEMGCSTIQLKKGGRESIVGLMEIVYTGKLDRIRTYSETKLMEILEVARFLEVDYAVQYLMKEIPEGKPVRPKTNVEKLIQDRLRSLPVKRNWSNMSLDQNEKLDSSLNKDTVPNEKRRNIRKSNALGTHLNNQDECQESASMLDQPLHRTSNWALQSLLRGHTTSKESLSRKNLSNHRSALENALNAADLAIQQSSTTYESSRTKTTFINKSRKLAMHNLLSDREVRSDEEIIDYSDNPIFKQLTAAEPDGADKKQISRSEANQNNEENNASTSQS